MIRIGLALVLLLAARQEPKFVAYDVFIQTGDQALAAYQFELIGDASRAKIVGVEGGEGPFAPAPYYDPAALQGGRIIIAAFTLDEKPPAGKVRVARVHMHESAAVEYTPGLMVAAGPDKQALQAKIELVGVKK